MKKQITKLAINYLMSVQKLDSAACILENLS